MPEMFVLGECNWTADSEVLVGSSMPASKARRPTSWSHVEDVGVGRVARMPERSIGTALPCQRARRGQGVISFIERVNHHHHPQESSLAMSTPEGRADRIRLLAVISVSGMATIAHLSQPVKGASTARVGSPSHERTDAPPAPGAPPTSAWLHEQGTIANALGISDQTVKVTVSMAYARLGCPVDGRCLSRGRLGPTVPEEAA